MHRRMLILQDSTHRRGSSRFKNLSSVAQMDKWNSPTQNIHPKWTKVVEDLKGDGIMLETQHPMMAVAIGPYLGDTT